MYTLFDDPGNKLLSVGSHRSAPVDKTLKFIEPIASKFGITRVADVTGLDRIGIPVTLAIRPNSKSVAVSQGKGLTLEQAKTSALMEAIEIWHAENSSVPVFYGRMRDLRKDWKFIDMERLPKNLGIQFDETTPMLWVKSHELVSNTEKLVPFEMVHADYTRPIPPMHGYFPASTNGLASGNSLLEATCHAIAEVVERDALTLWHFTDLQTQQKQRIDLETVDCPQACSLIEHMKEADLALGAWTITSDTNLASVLVLIGEAKGAMGHIGHGAGCHLDRNIALRRALTEAAQTRLNYISGARDDLHLHEYQTEAIKQKSEWINGLLSLEDCPTPFHQIPTKTLETQHEDLDYMINNLRNVGIEEVCLVDLSQKEFQIPVARIIIPGLETPHDDDNFVAGSRVEALCQE